MKSANKKSFSQGKAKKNLLNEEINHQEVRLVGVEGEQLGIVSSSEALEKAKALGLDLVEIVPQAEPPVCRIMDFGKHLFEERKKRAEARKKQKQSQVKEIKFRPTTDIGDYNVKLKSLIRFLEDGDKAKITLRFRGREMSHQDIGMNLMKRIKEDLEPYGTIELEPKLEGKQMVMVFGPKKK
ncbi:MAG TPA: translation initiation factor IF-3 [Gammaproteobacteria bacterium]|nr:translation initiation factor IF-3 [Gammaproteobacteria bacterium]MEC8010156.1 translation initiation factor IF-3 [Pseudomonadota bacterium]HCK92112.1 translation initiation factor IF-3 [Gammaproteobacteria bacterium]